jgi:uncharacterized phage-like protein YoqJ
LISIAATGHRPQKLGGFGDQVYERLYQLAFNTLGLLQPDRVISGMALGWDQAVAEATLMLNVPLYAYIPFVGQESQWPPKSQKLYRGILAKATEIVECSPPGYSADKMQIRNIRMVDDCNLLIGLWDGSSGGTGNCVKYAQSINREFINFWPEWVKGN